MKPVAGDLPDGETKTAEFIAAAREALPALATALLSKLDECERLEAKVKELTNGSFQLTDAEIGQVCAQRFMAANDQPPH